jgi:ABC-type nitrate/sulfonate/bicarbonate transport system substrate-binding protein
VNLRNAHRAPNPRSPFGYRKGVVLLSSLTMLAAFALPVGGMMPVSAAAPKLTAVSVQLSWLNNVEFAGIYVAIQRGYYKKYGLNINPVSGGVSVDPRQVVADGQATIGTVAESTDEAIADAQKAGLIAFATNYQTNPGCFMVRANSGIKNAQGFRGKKIGLQVQAEEQVKGMLKYEHVPLKDVTLVTVGDDPTVFAEGKVDAYTAFAFNEPIAMHLQGIKTRCLSFSSMGLPAYGDVFIARKSTVKSSPQMLARFVKATQRGWQYTLTHEKGVTSMVLSKYSSGQDPKQQALQIKVEAKMLTSSATSANGLLAMSKPTWTQSLKFLASQGQVPKTMNPGDVETLKIIALAKKLH